MRYLLDHGAQIRGIRGLHAKLYLIGQRAIVTSANLTDAALPRNHELGLVSTDEGIVKACSVRRIESYDGNSVSYWYRDHKSGQIEHETLPAMKFVGRMAQHILPKGFQRIRYYGLHSNVRTKNAEKASPKFCPAICPMIPMAIESCRRNLLRKDS